MSDLILKSLPLLMQGLSMTLMIALCSSLISFCLGVIFGIFTCNQVRVPILTRCILGVTFVLRAIPFYVQLLLVYFVLPEITGIDLDAFSASYISLGVCSSGYVAQIIRGGANSLSIDMWEASQSLGYTKRETVIYVILPQVYRNVLPMLTNELESLLKSTSIAATIGMLELTRIGSNIVSREMEPLTIYCLVASFYVVLSLSINLFSKYLERKNVRS